MSFLDTWFRAPKARSKNIDYTTKSSTQMMQTVTPAAARHTPKRYDLMSKEGYGDNVIANRAINMVARGVASVPLRLFENGQKVLVHPLLDMLKAPNPMQKGTGLIYNMAGYYLIAGNSYLLAVGPEKGAPKELWLLRPDTVHQQFNQANMLTYFEQRIGSSKRCYDKDRVFHWKTFNPLSEWQGLSPLEAAATAIDLHNEGSRWNLALVQNGGCPSGVLYQEKAGDALNDEQFSRLKQQVTDHYTGAVNAGRPLLLEGGLRWQDMSINPSDMDWQAGKNMSAREIALAFGVPAQLVGIPDSQTYANMAEARLSLWEETILPLVHDLVESLNGWLVPRFGSNLELKPDLDDIPALEIKRARKMERLNKAGFMTVNEKRAALGLPPIDGGESLYGEKTSGGHSPDA